MQKTELEKMLAGDLYKPNDPELMAMRKRCKQLFYKFNHMPYEDRERGDHLIKELLGSTRDKFEILAPFYCDYGAHIHIGENFFSNFNLTILDCAEVRIGDNVMFGPNVQLYTAYHPLNAVERNKGPELAAPITIGNNVWFGGGVIVCQGVNIGDNTTIGAGSVVIKDVPPNVFAAGNPCKVIRTL